jgi:hypothetical protein
MTTALPKLEKLKSNPNWAKLPLFNRKNWTRLRFPARSPRQGYGSPAPVKVVRKIVSGAARRWFGLRLHH